MQVKDWKVGPSANFRRSGPFEKCMPVSITTHIQYLYVSLTMQWIRLAHVVNGDSAMCFHYGILEKQT